MPSITPPGGAVDWPAAEGTLGVVGVAPWATLHFCRALYSQVGARKDWHFPRVLLDINTKLPSRGRYLELGETDPSPAIAATIEELGRQGATLAVVVCNTAHIMYERWARNAPIPVLHILEETIRQAHRCGAQRLAALGSASLAASMMYARQAQAFGLKCVSLAGSEQSIVNELIATIKLTGGLGAAQNQAAGVLLAGLKSRGVDTIVAGCTELSSLEPLCTQAALRFVDSNVALARSALERLGLPAGMILPESDSNSREPATLL